MRHIEKIVKASIRDGKPDPEDVVQVLDRSMSAAAAQGSFLFHCCNRRAVEAGLISIDDPGLGVRWIAESLAEQAFGRRRIA